MEFINEPDLSVKEGWKKKALNGEPMETIVVEHWERENHRGHVASLASLCRYAGLYDQHELYGVLGKSGVRTLVVLGEMDGGIEPEKARNELVGLGWTGDIKVIMGATHQVVRTHVKEVAGLLGGFG
jgi:hypothetical protein